MLPIIVYLDLETTGATPLRDRITEIALVRVENGVETARWQTLVNPQTTIPPFIEKLTGISNAMVQNAPTFAEVADELSTFLTGAVMAAHNVRFDHGFLKSEYKRLELNFKQRLLCTVKLSRKLYPEHRKHSLDAIMARHNLTTEKRHRAMNDVELMIGFVDSAQKELGINRVAQVAIELSKQPSLPRNIDQNLVNEIPETSGVYLFYGDSELPLYIGKSVKLRDRIMSHFSGDHASSKEMRISQEIKHIEWIETPGELGALLLESKLVKEMQPIYNRQLRRQRQLFSWQISDNPAHFPQIKLINASEIHPTMLSNLYGTYRSKRQALEALKNIVDTHNLCKKALGLESGKGRCFASQLKKCKGVCEGNESTTHHHLRLLQALSAHKLKAWPYDGKLGVKEVCLSSGKTAIHIIDQWCHITTVDNESDYQDALSGQSIFAFDYDTYKLLLKALNSNKYQIIQLNN